MSLYIYQNSQNVQHRVKPNINYGLWVITMCRCWFIDCNKCTTVVGDVDSRVGCAFRGRGYKGTLLAAQFCCKPKTILKKLSLLENDFTKPSGVNTSFWISTTTHFQNVLLLLENLEPFLINCYPWQLKNYSGDFPGGPVVKTPCFHCRGRRLDPWLGS